MSNRDLRNRSNGGIKGTSTKFVNDPVGELLGVSNRNRLDEEGVEKGFALRQNRRDSGWLEFNSFACTNVLYWMAVAAFVGMTLALWLEEHDCAKLYDATMQNEGISNVTGALIPGKAASLKVETDGLYIGWCGKYNETTKAYDYEGPNSAVYARTFEKQIASVVIAWVAWWQMTNMASTVQWEVKARSWFGRVLSYVVVPADNGYTGYFGFMAVLNFLGSLAYTLQHAMFHAQCGSSLNNHSNGRAEYLKGSGGIGEKVAPCYIKTGDGEGRVDTEWRDAGITFQTVLAWIYVANLVAHSIVWAYGAWNYNDTHPYTKAPVDDEDYDDRSVSIVPT
ncbi:MAG: hypothetical protein ACTSUE_09125 [Promethearchaeota archaeon]